MLAVFVVVGFCLIQVQYNDAPGVSIMRGLGQEFVAHGLDQSTMGIENGLPSFSLLFLWLIVLMALVLAFSLLKKLAALLATSGLLVATWTYLYFAFTGVFNRVEFLQSSVFFVLSMLILLVITVRNMREHRARSLTSH